jgi:hypothetical protein
MNALQSLLNIVGGAAAQGIKNIPSAVARANSVYQDFKTDLPANTAYYTRNLFGPAIPLTTYQEFSKNQNAPELTPQQMINYSVNESLYPGQEKTNSANINDRYVAPPDQQVDQLKQRVLSGAGFRPAMQRYLSTVPIVERPIAQHGAAGESVGNYSQYYNSEPSQGDNQPSWENPPLKDQPMIYMDPSVMNHNDAGNVLLHEYIHTVQRNPDLKQSFIDFSKTINQDTQPLLYSVGLTYFRNGKLPPNPEEFYATLGQQLGPRALLIPEIRNFYMNIFSNNQEKTPFSPLSYPGSQTGISKQ